MSAVILQLDLTMTSRFLDALDPTGIFTFQTFGEAPGMKGKLIKVLHGTLQQHAVALSDLNRKGASINVMVNEGDGVTHVGERTCRVKASVLRVRSLFIDLDGSPIQPVIDAEPDLIVESSADRWHAYWLVNDCLLENFSMLQEQLIKKFNADPSVKDLPRVMRLPGFLHQKNEPFLSRLIFPGA
jgi:RepB DNA-primase from phage plasmid